MTTLDEAVAAGRGVERPFNCHVHDDSNASASVNVVKEVWYCYTCGAAGRVGKGNPTVAMKAAIEAMRSPIDTPPHHEGWLDIFDADHPSKYWAARVGEATAEKFRCGTHPYTGLPTYPIRNRVGQPLGVVLRTPDGFTGPKYLYPHGVPVSQCLFGYDQALAHPGRIVVIVEGAGDVMAIDAAFSNTPPFTIVGSYGCNINAPQVPLLTALSPLKVVIAYDNDTAGMRGGQQAVSRLTQAGITASVHPYRNTTYKDFGSMPTSMIREELSAYDLRGMVERSAATSSVA